MVFCVKILFDLLTMMITAILTDCHICSGTFCLLNQASFLDAFPANSVSKNADFFSFLLEFLSLIYFRSIPGPNLGVKYATTTQ